MLPFRHIPCTSHTYFLKVALSKIYITSGVFSLSMGALVLSVFITSHTNVALICAKFT